VVIVTCSFKAVRFTRSYLSDLFDDGLIVATTSQDEKGLRAQGSGLREKGLRTQGSRLK